MEARPDFAPAMLTVPRVRPCCSAWTRPACG